MTWFIFNELANAQAIMYYSRHRLTASVAYVIRSRTHQPTTKELILLAHWSVRQKLNRVSSVQFSSLTSLCTRLKMYGVVLYKIFVQKMKTAVSH